MLNAHVFKIRLSGTEPQTQKIMSKGLFFISVTVLTTEEHQRAEFCLKKALQSSAYIV